MKKESENAVAVVQLLFLQFKKKKSCAKVHFNFKHFSAIFLFRRINEVITHFVSTTALSVLKHDDSLPHVSFRSNGITPGVIVFQECDS